MHKSLVIDETVLAAFCRQRHIVRLSLFGSQLKGTASASSDVDLLVSFDPEHTPTFFDMARIEQELSELLGRKVDLRTAAELSPYFRPEVIAQAQVQYAA